MINCPDIYKIITPTVICRNYKGDFLFFGLVHDIITVKPK